MRKNDDFDQKVLKLIHKVGNVKFGDVVLRMNRGRKPGKGVNTRELDRALQRLRKAGYVAFDSKTGWYAV